MTPRKRFSKEATADPACVIANAHAGGHYLVETTEARLVAVPYRSGG